MIKLTDLLSEGLGPSSSMIKKIEDFLKKELKVSNVKGKKYSQGRARVGYTFYPEGTKNGLYIDQAYDGIWNIYTVGANGFPINNHWEIKKYEDDIEDEATALKAAFDVIKKFGKTLKESVNEEFTAVSNKSGKTVVFKDKDARDAAVKAGTHSDDEESGKEEPKGEKKPNMFSKDTGYDSGGEDKPQATVNPLLKNASKHDLDDMSKPFTVKVYKPGSDTYTMREFDFENIEDAKKYAEKTGGKLFKKEQGKGSLGKTVSYLKDVPADEEPDTKSDDAPSIDLSPDEDGRMSFDSALKLQDLLNKELGVEGNADVDYNSGAITYGLANSEGDWDSALYIGQTDDGGKISVSVEANGGSDFGTYKEFDNQKEALAYATELAKQYKDKFAAPEPKEPHKPGLLPSQANKNSFNWTRGKLQPKKADKKLLSLVNKLSKKAKLDPNKISHEEYEKRMLSLVHDALEDANFHGANRQIFADLQGKPELAKRPDYSKAPEMGTPERDEWDMNNSIYNKTFDSITSEFDGSNDFATTISSESGWDGEQTIAALLMKMRKDGHGNLADIVQTSFDKAMEKNEGTIKLTNLI